jgi:Phage integrase family
VRKRFKSAIKRAKVRNVRFHDLRHTFGTRMAAVGVPMRTGQEWMGYRDFATTLIYADYSPSQLPLKRCAYQQPAEPEPEPEDHRQGRSNPDQRGDERGGTVLAEQQEAKRDRYPADHRDAVREHHVPIAEIVVVSDQGFHLWLDGSSPPIDRLPIQ